MTAKALTTDDSLHSPSSKDQTLTATCHCGRIKIQLPSKPERIGECHCSICYKYGALWAYFPRDKVTVTMANGTTIQSYLRDDLGRNASTSFNRCSTCGCMTHWWGEVEPYNASSFKMGVNCRMLPEKQIEDIEREVIWC